MHFNEMQTVCRLCCENEGIVDIFDNTHEFKPSMKIMYCCNKSKVNIEEDDPLPKLICSTCNIQLDETYNFILQCEASDQKLRSIEFSDQNNIHDYTELDHYSDESKEIKIEFKNEEHYSPSRTKKSSPQPEKKRRDNENTGTKRKRVIKKQGRVDCSKCGKTCLNNSSLLAHMRSHSEKRAFQCTHCHKTYKDPTSLKRHINRNHTEYRTRNFTCDNCGKQFLTKSYLKVHTRIHTGETPYVCKLCPARFNQIGTLIRHKRLHTGERPFSCNICQKKFGSKSELGNHINTHSQEKNYTCLICNLKLKHSYTLKKHMRQHENKPKCFICDLCGKEFSYKGNLVIHIKERHSAQSGYCTICSKYATNIETHMWKHNNYRGFKCDYCSSSFFDKKGLIRHMTYKHQDYKHKCSEKGCGALFPVKEMLNFHVLKVHATVKPFTCDMCSRAFYRKSDYVRHKLGTHKIKEK